QVRALPGLLWICLGQRADERSSALGAAWVVPPVRAHEEQRLPRVLQPTVPISSQVPNVEVEDAAKIGQHSPARHGLCRIRVHHEHPGALYGPEASEPPDEEDPHATGTAAMPQLAFQVRRQPSVTQRLDPPRSGRLYQQIAVNLRSSPPHGLPEPGTAHSDSPCRQPSPSGSPSRTRGQLRTSRLASPSHSARSEGL